jgi:hypothetical protein
MVGMPAPVPPLHAQLQLADPPTHPDTLEVFERAPIRHEPEVIERGSFARAQCRGCGWAAPARRARALAVHDADQHRAAPGR